MKLIDKDKIVAEIDRLYEEEGSFYASDVLYELEVFIDNLEEEHVSEDLEEAAIRIADEILPIAGREIWYGETEENIERRKQIREGVKRGANWQKEQMMKDAVDAEVGYWNIRGLSLNVRLKGDIKDGDRVKLIMIKEE